jgi:hypothetical protein
MKPGLGPGEPDRRAMTKWKIALYGGLAAILIRQEMKQRAVINALSAAMDVLEDHVDRDFQERVDNEFDEIVETYDE